nr:MAG TPA: hypothetical protein [Caudoviricetes sp.]
MRDVDNGFWPKHPKKTVYIRVYIIKNRIRNKPASMRH